MKRIDRLAEIVRIEMGVDLGGDDRGMAKHLLYGAQIGSAFHEMRGEGVPQTVRGDGLGDAGLCGGFADDVEDHDAGQLFAASIEKHNIPGGWIYIEHAVSIAFEVEANLKQGFVAYRDEAFFVVFTDDTHQAKIRIEMADPKAGQLRYPQTTGI